MSDFKVIPAPRKVDIAITGRCNLACQYCFYADEMVARTDLPTERWLAFFEELGRLKVMDVCLTGGEVFTRPDLFELIDGVIANRMRYQILTNGTLITEKVLSKFEEGKRRLRLNSIQISVDGATAEVHDKSRPKSFERALLGLRLLLEAGFPTTVRVTVNQHNVDDLEDIARLLLEDVGLPSFSTNEAFSCGATSRAEGDVVLTSAQRRRAMETLEDLSAHYNGRISANAGPLAIAHQFRKMEEALVAGLASLPGRGTLGSCGGAFNTMAVLHDGTIVPCHNLSTLRLGSVGVDDFQQVWLEHPVMDVLRHRSEIPLSSLETCRDCAYIGFCCGGCPAGALFLTGELDGRNPMDCIRIHKGEDPYYDADDVLSKALKD